MHKRSGTATQLDLKSAIANRQKIKNVTFILATKFVDGSPFPPFYEKAKAKGLTTLTISCGHDVMLDRPAELTKVLLNSLESSRSAGKETSLWRE